MAEITSIATQNPLSVRPTDTLLDVIDVLSKKGFRRLPVVHDYELVGIITASDIIRVLQTGDIKLLEKEIHNFMSPEPLFVYRDTEASEAVTLMYNHQIGALPILSPRDGTLTGIITERDLVKAFVESIADADLEGFVNYQPVVINYNRSTIIDVIDALAEGHSNRLLMVDSKNKLKGMITTKDVLKLLNSEIIKFGKPAEDIFNMKAKKVAATDLFTTTIDKSVAEVTAMLLEKRIGGIPVVEEDNTLIGIFTERSLLQLIGTYQLM